MAPETLNLPSDLLQNKSLTPSQKLILSLTSTKSKMYSLEIAKSLGTRRSDIQPDLDNLVDQGYLSRSNGGGRITYILQDGSYVINQTLVKPLDQESLQSTVATPKVATDLLYNNNERSELILYNKYENTKAKALVYNNNTKLDRYNTYSLGAGSIAESAYAYWLDCGGREHKKESKACAKSMDMLEQLFSGKAFDHVLPQNIPDPKLNKQKKFTLEEFKTSLDNYLLSVYDPNYFPGNKEKMVQFRKKLPVNEFIYNNWSAQGKTRSLFLQYLKPPTLLHSEINRYSRLMKALSKELNKLNLPFRLHEGSVVTASNQYGDLLKKLKIKYQSLPEVARYFAEFVESKGLQSVKAHWFNVNWFYVDLRNFLDRKGLI